MGCEDGSNHRLMQPWPEGFECAIDGCISLDQVWSALDMMEWGRPPSSGMITLYVCGRAGSKRSAGISSVAMVAIAEQD
eukprot:2912313-Alexandrium_andersonii.AAC.1